MKTDRGRESESMINDDESLAQQNWLCISCFQLGCGRYSKDQHALKHFHSNPKHPFAINVKSLQVFCYACDDDLEDQKDRSSSVSEFLNSVQELSQLYFAGKLEDKDMEMKDDDDLNTVQLDQKQEDDLCLCVRGLVNLGNTCKKFKNNFKGFFNSTLQCLNASRFFFLSFMDLMNGKTSPYPKGSLNNAFWDFYVDMRQETRKAYNPENLFKGICRRQGRFRGFQQQDAQDMLLCLFDICTQEHDRIYKDKTRPPHVIESAFGGKMISSEISFKRGDLVGSAGMAQEFFAPTQKYKPTQATITTGGGGFLCCKSRKRKEQVELNDADLEANTNRKIPDFNGSTGFANSSERLTPKSQEGNQDQQENPTIGSEKEHQQNEKGGEITAEHTPTKRRENNMSVQQKLEEAKKKLMEQQQMNNQTGITDASPAIPQTKKYLYDSSKKFVRIDVREEGFEEYAYFEPQPDVNKLNENSLIGCLGHFTKNEEMKDAENLYQCEECSEEKYGKASKNKVMTVALRRIMIHEAPRNLIINLKRFTQTGYSLLKRTDEVKMFEYEEHQMSQEWKPKYQYKLYGIVSHSGSMSGGHYVSYTCQRVDSNVKKCSEDEVLRAEAYLLFYKRI